jgi:hypothetical protein
MGTDSWFAGCTAQDLHQWRLLVMTRRAIDPISGTPLMSWRPRLTGPLGGSFLYLLGQQPNWSDAAALSAAAP